LLVHLSFNVKSEHLYLSFDMESKHLYLLGFLRYCRYYLIFMILNIFHGIVCNVIHVITFIER